MTHGLAGGGAFRNDEGLKRELLATIDRHVAAGTLVFDGTVWDGSRGTALGIAVEGEDAAAYADRYNMPLALVPFMERVLAGIPERDGPAVAARAWVDAIIPGTDLSQVPTQVMLSMLDVEEGQGIDEALVKELAALHLSDLSSTPPSRAEWSAVRRTVMEQLERHDLPPSTDAAYAFWEACTWSAIRGRSTLSTAFDKWCRLRARGADGDWKPQEAARSHELLNLIWNEQQPCRDAGEPVDYPALFHARVPELAKRFEDHLARTNARFLESAGIMIDRCLILLKQAPAACAS